MKIFVGKVTYDELHKYYGISDAYIHPGKEPYSLAFMEAAITGLYLISSDQVGAAADVLYNGKNGRLIPYDHLNSLVHAMETVLKDNYSKASVSAVQQYFIQQRNNQWAVNQLRKAIDCATKYK